MSDQAPPDVSVIIAVRNRPGQILDAIASCLAQQGVDLEVIVVDDGSTDETPNVVASIPDRRVHLIRTPPSGVTCARNIGALAAHARWLITLDSDDMLLPNALSRLIAATGDEVDVVCGASEHRHADGTIVRCAPTSFGPEFLGVQAQFLAGTALVRASAWHAIDGQLPGLAYGENTEFGMRLAAHVNRLGRRIVAIESPTMRYTVSGRHYDHLARAQATQLIIARNRALFDRSGGALAVHWSIAAVQFARAGWPSDALRCQLRAVRAHPTSGRHLARLLVLLVPPLRRRRYRPDVDDAFE